MLLLLVKLVTDKTKPKAITWLDRTLPESSSAFKDDADTLNKLRKEARILDEELNRESERNSELQDQIIASRTRSDQMVALMQLLRSETEAVLQRCAVLFPCILSNTCPFTKDLNYPIYIIITFVTTF